MPQMTALGELLESARAGLNLSKREAARRAGISEGRWRQIVSGEQKAGDITIPVNPRANTVVAMARAVGVDAAQALEAAGLEADLLLVQGDGIAIQLKRTERPDTATNQVEHYVESIDAVSDHRIGDPAEALIAEIMRDDAVPDDRKHILVQAIRRAEAQRQADLQAAEDELANWRRRHRAG